MGLDIQGFAGNGVDVAAACYLAWQNTFLTQQSGLIRLNSVEVKYGPESTGPSFTSSGESVGSLGGSTLAPNTCYLVEKNTNLGGRKGRGRMFIPGTVAASMTDTGALNTTRLNAMNAACSDFLGTLNAADLPAVLLHGDATAPTDIINMSTDPVLATQRRRLR